MKVGIVTGAFDLLHAGHLHLLAESKKRCDYLIVALHENPKLERADKNMPIETVLERQMRLEACKYVNQVIVYKTEHDLQWILNCFAIDVRFLGSDYVDSKKPVTEPDLIPIEYIPSFPLHTSDLRRRIKSDNN